MDETREKSMGVYHKNCGFNVILGDVDGDIMGYERFILGC